MPSLNDLKGRVIFVAVMPGIAIATHVVSAAKRGRAASGRTWTGWR